MNISLVPTEAIREVWPVVETMLAAAVRRTRGRYNIADVFTDILTGTQSLWIAFPSEEGDAPPDIVGCATIRIANYPNMKVARLEYLAGRDREKWLEAGWPVICKYAKEFGCSKIELDARLGLKKDMEKYGFDFLSAVYEFDLEKDQESLEATHG